MSGAGVASAQAALETRAASARRRAETPSCGPRGVARKRRRTGRKAVVDDDIRERIERASKRAVQAAEATASAHENAADEHERHARVAQEIGENLEDAHR